MSEKVVFGDRGRLVPTLTVLACAGVLAASAACSSAASDDSSAGGETTTSVAATATGDAGRSSSAEAGECARPTVDLIDLETRDDAEPLVRLPVPAGWERNTMMDSEIVRGVIGAPDLADPDRETVPVINVVLEDVTEFDGDAREVLDLEVAAYGRIGGTVTDRSPTRVCGLPAERVEVVAQVMGPEESEMSALIAVYEAEEATYAVVVTAQGSDPQNPDYRDAVDTVFEQIQILPGGGRA